MKRLSQCTDGGVAIHVAIPQVEIDEINELHIQINRDIRKVFADCCKMGDWFLAAREKLRQQSNRQRYPGWNKWLETHFPKISFSTVYNYMRIAENREFLKSVRCEEIISQTEAVRLIRERNKQERKPRVRRILVESEAEPLVVLEAKLKNYVISLWMLKYLQTEIEGLIESAGLKPDQIMRVLHFVCKEHQEVQDDVIRIFQPGIKIFKKGA